LPALVLFDPRDQDWNEYLYEGNHIINAQRTKSVIDAMHICIASGWAKRFNNIVLGYRARNNLSGMGLYFSDEYLLSLH